MTVNLNSDIQHLLICQPSQYGSDAHQEFYAVFYKKVYVDNSLNIYGFYYDYIGGPRDIYHGNENFRLIFNNDLTKILHFYKTYQHLDSYISDEMYSEDYNAHEPYDFENVAVSEFDKKHFNEIHDEIEKWIFWDKDIGCWEPIPSAAEFASTFKKGRVEHKTEGIELLLIMLIMRYFGRDLRFTKRKQFDCLDEPPFPPLLPAVKRELTG